MYKYKKLLLLSFLIIFYSISFGWPFLYLTIKFISKNNDIKKVSIFDYDINPYPNPNSNIYLSYMNKDIILTPSKQLPMYGEIFIHSIPPIGQKKYLIGRIKICNGEISLVNGFGQDDAKICLIVNADAEEAIITNIHNDDPAPTPPPPPFGQCILR